MSERRKKSARQLDTEIAEALSKSEGTVYDRLARMKPVEKKRELKDLQLARDQLLRGLGYAGNTPDQVKRYHTMIEEVDAKMRLFKKPSTTHHSTARKATGPSWKKIAADYKRIAKSAKAAGGKVVREHGAILILPTEGSDEYYYEDWQADELIDRIKRENGKVLDYISIEDLLLAQSQHW